MDSRPVKIYCKQDVPRLRYIAGLILGEILGLSLDVVTDKRKLGKYQVINYTNENIPGSFTIKPVPLLFENGVSEQQIIVSRYKGLPVIFPTVSGSDLPFDIFAASFFLVTRYEEYLEFQPDEYGRFKASSSVAFKNDFLEIPVVDLWARELSKILLTRFPTLTFKRNEYRAMLTIDPDQPFAYPGKSLLNSIGELFRDIKNKTGTAGERSRNVPRSDKDPGEVFDYIIDCIEKNKSDLRFFFPVGDHSKYDKNPSWENDEYRNLIERISLKYEIGLHPSFNAAFNYSTICTELTRLKTIAAKDVIASRFHYIRLKFPESYRDIFKAGISEDYSMGYPDEPGFRAGIARSFYFYDLLMDQVTNLRILPFQVMDETLYKYKNPDPERSKELILKLINETRKAGGQFISIWHNTSLIEIDEMAGRREVFEFMLKNQAPCS